VGILAKPHFRGQSIVRLDGKGRLRIPTKYREVLQRHYQDALVITRLDECLVAYPPQIWQQIEAKVMGLSQVDPNQRNFQRFFISSAEDCSFDSQGRILIPPVLKKHAGLEQEVLLAGMLNCFEIWEAGRWEKRMEWSQEHFSELAGSVTGLGL
jgi:MraZ protein